MSIRLGDLLVRANIITEGQLKMALSEQAKFGGKLGEILVRMRYCDEEIVVRAISKQLNLPRAELDGIQALAPVMVRQLVQKVPVDASRELDVVPVQLLDEGRTLVVALADPLITETIDALRARTRCKVICQIAGSMALERARARLYGGEERDSSRESGLKLTDALGRTLVGSPPKDGSPAVSASAADLLSSFEDLQRKEVAALKAMVEILVEKGVFTREEYLARVKR